MLRAAMEDAAMEVNTSLVDVQPPEQPECWICRDPTVQEALVQPCACRGSMSGVHASCVERWIQHRRSSSGGRDVPRCSVCRQPYTGTVQHPGVGAFAWQLCRRSAVMAQQLAIWIVLCNSYARTCSQCIGRLTADAVQDNGDMIDEFLAA